MLWRIDGRGYKSYRVLRGLCEDVSGVRVCVRRVQGDPFAPPSVVEARFSLGTLPRSLLRYGVAVADYLLRVLRGELEARRRKLGEGHSGFLGVPRPSPIIIRRSALIVRGEMGIARIWVGLPSRRRRVLGEEARWLLLEAVPGAIRATLRRVRERQGDLERHVRVWRLQEELRSRLPGLGLVSFIGDGSILPRRCGGCWDPLPGAVPFESPPSLRVEVETECCGLVTGMGIKRGVTVIAGSAFHGKTTLLEAIASGVWNNIPGDGRERVVTIRSAMYVRAEDGRYISCVDVDSFIHDLPGGRPTRCFSTSDASGATSVAAAIQEAVEVGAELLLFDEDTSATNMLYLDERAKPLTRRHTVTPLAELARSMKEKGVSLVIVSTGSLPLLAVADTVIVMEDYRARDATSDAKSLASSIEQGKGAYKPPRKRIIKHITGLVKPRVRAGMLTAKNLETPLPLTNNIHLVEESQLNALAAIAARISREKGRLLAEVVKEYEERMVEDPAWLGESPGLGEVRGLDIAFLVNRLPLVVMRPSRD